MSTRIKAEAEDRGQTMSTIHVNHEPDELDQEQEDEILEEDEDERDASLTDEDRMVILMSNSNSLDESYENGNGSYDDGEHHDNDNGSILESVLGKPKTGRGSGRANKFWSPPIEQVFLEKIKRFSCLYDHRDENWKNKKHKEGVWEHIGSEVGIPAMECRRHFKHMRDKFVRNKRTGKNPNNRFTRGMSFLVDLDLIKHRPKPMDDIQFLGSMSTGSSRNGSGRSTPILESHKTYSSILPKRHYLDIDGGDEEDDDSSYMHPDTVMDSQPSQLSSVTITRSRNITPVPKRTPINTAGSASRSLAAFMSGRDSLGNIAYSTNAMPTLTTIGTGSLLATTNGFTIPRTISQTTITPAYNKSTNGSTNGTSNSSSSSGGPNYFFGQYIASVLDSLPQAESLLTRHKLQEILFEAQSRLATPQKQLIDFKCANCCNIYQGSAQLP